MLEAWLFLILMVLTPILLVVNIVVEVRQRRQPPAGPTDLRRADDGIPSEQDLPWVHGARATWIPVQKWPPDDPSGQR